MEVQSTPPAGNGGGTHGDTRAAGVPCEQPSELGRVIAELGDVEGAVRVLQLAIESGNAEDSDLAGAAAAIAAQLDSIGEKLAAFA